jgi:hypothetical protein
MLQAGRSRVRLPMRSLDFFNLPNPSSRTVVLGLTQPLIKMSNRNLLGGKQRPARKVTTSQPSIGRLSGENVGVSTSHNPMGFTVQKYYDEGSLIYYSREFVFI